MDPDKIALFTTIGSLMPFIATIVIVSVAGWVVTTWMRVKNGYPLDGKWGQALHPAIGKDSVERIKLLTSENAQLRAELGAIRDRLETVERIVTDQPARLAREIDSLSLVKGGQS